MKTTRTSTLLGAITLSLLIIISCKKSDLLATSKTSETEVSAAYQSATVLPDGSTQAGGVNLDAPAQVNINEQFNIHANISCGKVAIDRGYILAGDGITKIYKGIECGTANLQWEEIVGFACYTNDATWTGSLPETGTYVFRTRHNASDGNCDGLGGSNTSGQCSFSGNQFYCFTIEAINSCQTSFTGEAVSCTNSRGAIYHFTSVTDLSDVKIQGGLTNFTGDDAVVTITGGNLSYTQSTTGGSSNRVITIKGSVTACQPVTITITWNSSNSGGVITGSWSVTDGNVGEVAPPIAGLTCSN